MLSTGREMSRALISDFCISSAILMLTFWRCRADHARQPAMICRLPGK